MNPIVTILDLDEDHELFDQIKSRGFEDVESPIDGVTYPDLCVLEDWKEWYGVMLTEILNLGRVQVNHLFARMMREGIKAPHKVHCDANMGEYSAHLYLSKDWPAGSGTAFYTHSVHGPRERVLNTPLPQDDYHSFDGWSEYLRVQAKQNRLLVHDSASYHSALPDTGFGSDIHDARIALTCFFEIL